MAAGVVGFGLVLVLAPGFTRQGFSLLVWSSPGHIDAFGPEPARYVSLVHAVIGGVMVGWGALMFVVTHRLISKGSRLGWNLIVLSVVAWFVPDTTYSLWSGFWQNAILNIVFLCLFALPLWGTRKFARSDP